MSEWNAHEEFWKAKSTDLDSFVAGAKAYQQHLSPCITDPCGQCRDPHKFDGGCYDEPNCAPKARYQGTLSGLAMGRAQRASRLTSEYAKGHTCWAKVPDRAILDGGQETLPNKTFSPYSGV